MRTKVINLKAKVIKTGKIIDVYLIDGIYRTVKVENGKAYLSRYATYYRKEELDFAIFNPYIPNIANAKGGFE